MNEKTPPLPSSEIERNACAFCGSSRDVQKPADTGGKQYGQSQQLPESPEFVFFQDHQAQAEADRDGKSHKDKGLQGGGDGGRDSHVSTPKFSILSALADLLFDRFFVFFLGFAFGTLASLFVVQDVFSMVDKSRLLK